MYFYNEEEGVHHATIITEVGADGIKYSSNTVNRYNYNLTDGIGNDLGVLIVRIDDGAK